MLSPHRLYHLTNFTFWSNVIKNREAVMITEKLRSFLLKICALLFFIALILCLVLPIQRARDNKVDEYRDLYRYQLTAQNYYRVLHASIYNLNMLASQIETKGGFNTLSTRDDLLDTDDDLTGKLNRLYATLRTIPDPGDRSLVAAVYDCHSVYLTYHDLVLSGNYHAADYLDTLHDTRASLREVERDLFYEAYDK